MLNFIAVDSQLYKIIEIMRVSFFGSHCITKLILLQVIRLYLCARHSR